MLGRRLRKRRRPYRGFGRDAGGVCTKLSLGLKPGKPLAVGVVGGMAILALPGNPFASLVGGTAVRPSHAAGDAGSFRGRQRPVAARTADTFTHRAGRTEFVPVRAAGVDDDGVPLLEKLGRGRLGRLWPSTTADGLASIPAEAGDLAAGASLGYYPFGSAFGL